MDWPQAKSVLIIAFALVNLYMGAALWQATTNRAAWSVSPDRSDEAIRIADLAERGLTLRVELPAPPPPLPLIKVRVATPEGDELARALFGETTGVTVLPWPGTPGGATYRRAAEELTVLDLGFVRYQRYAPAEGEGSLTLAAAREEADLFLERLRFDAEARFDYAEPLPDGGYRVRYVQQFRRWPLFGGYVDLQLDASGVRSLERWWLEPIGFGTRRAVMPADEALIRLADTLREEVGPIVVIDLALGYVSEFYEAKEWDVVPAWRVRTAAGTTYYVNAYTGTLEQ